MSNKLPDQMKAQVAQTIPRPASSLLQRKCDCGQHTMAGGECVGCSEKRLQRRPASQSESRGTRSAGQEVVRSPGQPLEAANVPAESHFGHDFSSVSLRIQPKLKVSQPGDRYEQEADQLSEQIMRMAAPIAAPASHDERPRAELTEGTIAQKIQRQETTVDAGMEAPEPVARGVASLSGGGSPMDSHTRAFMEPRFGQDFSQVRVHTDAHAAQMASSVGAQAFTTGRDVVFASGQYAPQTDWGKQLLAHELTHVVQQGGQSTGSVISRRLDPSLCAKPAGCAKPDTVGTGSPSSWQLTLAVDREEKGLGRLVSGNVGHTWVKLSDDVGEKYSYGFWPQTGFNSKKPFSTVAGCVHHPDTAHEPPRATNYLSIDYKLTKENYAKAVDHAQSVCNAKPGYNLFTYNCTSFAIDVAKAAEVSPPASTTLAVHNPNALFEGIEEKRDEGHPGLGALLGGLGGAGIGVAIGSLLGPAGMIVGGLIGGLAGAVTGALIGDKH